MQEKSYESEVATEEIIQFGESGRASAAVNNWPRSVEGKFQVSEIPEFATVEIRTVKSLTRAQRVIRACNMLLCA